MKNQSKLVFSIIGGLTLLTFLNGFLMKSSTVSKTQDGGSLYSANCASCHMGLGDGMKGVYPPLAKSDYLMADKKRSIRQVLNGVQGLIKVNGENYNSSMAAMDYLTDKEVAEILNFVRNSWGNSDKGDRVTEAEVKAERR